MEAARRMKSVKILFVCMGNICRSPTAEGVFKKLVEEASLEHCVVSDSAGTHDYHVGEAPDARAQDAARARGYDLSSLCARQVSRRDFQEFDYVLAMDEVNLRALRRLCPPEYASKLKLFLEFAGNPAVREVPDPYYGDTRGFERVLDLVEGASRGLIAHLRKSREGVR